MRMMKANFASIFYLLIAAALLLCAALNDAKAVSGTVPYSFFLEHPYSSTGFSGNLEIAPVDGGGALIMNRFRADLNLGQNILGIYAKFPFSGVTTGVFGKGDYDFGNIGLGTKYALLSSNNAALTFGFEAILPTTGNSQGALGARSYFRDFVYFTDDAYTFVPYGIFAIGGDVLAFQANLDFDIMTNARNADESPFDAGGESAELIIKYGAAASVTPRFNLPFSTSFLLELLCASSTTFDNNVTGVYVTPGIRFGGIKYSFGAGVQVPFGSDEITDFANIDFLMDMKIRFGG